MPNEVLTRQMKVLAQLCPTPGSSQVLTLLTPGVKPLLTLVVLESPLGTRVLPGWIVRSSRPPSPPGGLLRVGPGRAQPTVVRESSKVNWF